MNLPSDVSTMTPPSEAVQVPTSCCFISASPAIALAAKNSSANIVVFILIVYKELVRSSLMGCNDLSPCSMLQFNIRSLSTNDVTPTPITCTVWTRKHYALCDGDRVLGCTVPFSRIQGASHGPVKEPHFGD
jgi:hypothetical protein